MGNLDHWMRFEDIDPAFTKPITGKAYKGTSPNPQYVIRCLTELFGPVGEGFGWDVVAEEFTPLGEEVLHWCRIRFWHGSRDNHWDSYGQTKALMKTRNGLMSDEDAPKKSLTDAIIKAASQLGIAANIFLGRWDDHKHVQEVTEKYREANTPPAEEVAEEQCRTASPEMTAGLAQQYLMAAKTHADLRAVFAKLYNEHRAIADMPEVIAAKDVRKEQLTPKEAAA